MHIYSNLASFLINEKTFRASCVPTWKKVLSNRFYKANEELFYHCTVAMLWQINCHGRSIT